MKISRKEIDSISDLEEQRLIDQNKLKPSNNGQYVNNKELYAEFVKYNKKKKEWLEQGKGVPPLTEKIGAAILQIANRRCNARKYFNYSNAWKEEMISNAILIATMRAHNFDPDKYNNPFAYVTQICDNAIIEQIKKEKKELYAKYKQIEEVSGLYAQTEEYNEDDHYNDYIMDSEASTKRREFIDAFEHSVEERKRKSKEDYKRKKNQTAEDLSKFFEGNDE